jgi:hypothetical protein
MSIPVRRGGSPSGRSRLVAPQATQWLARHVEATRWLWPLDDNGTMVVVKKLRHLVRPVPWPPPLARRQDFIDRGGTAAPSARQSLSPAVEDSDLFAMR